MAETLTMISIILFFLSGVFAVFAIVLWFVFKIPSVIGDLSGRTARKSIEQMRQNNKKTGIKSYKTSSKNLERGKLTETIEKTNKDKREILETGLLKENIVQAYKAAETGLLADEENKGCFGNEMETASLIDGHINIRRKAAAITIKLLGEVMYVHTEEEI